MKRILWPVAILIVFLIVIRFIVTPLAQQRESRLIDSPPAVAFLPAEATDWVYARSSQRAFDSELWPEGRDFALEKAMQLGLRPDEVEAVTGLRPFGQGEWLFASSDEHWWLLGPITRFLRSAEGAAILEEDAALWRSGDFLVSARCDFFLLSDSQEALDFEHGSWLASLPEWSELGDLMVAGDLLLYHREGEAAALGGTKKMGKVLLSEGFQWGGGGASLMKLVDPMPAPSGIWQELDDPPSLLRSSAPWDPKGRPLDPGPCWQDREAGRWNFLKTWARGHVAAYAHVIAPSSVGAQP